MCVFSYCGDYFRDTAPAKPWWPAVEPVIYPGTVPFPPTTTPNINPSSNPSSPTVPLVIGDNITRAEFDALKRDIEELKLLLQAAKRFDEKTGQPDCETEAKVALIKQLADLVGVDMAEVFGK